MAGKKNQYFTKRGVKTVTIDHDNETLDVTIKVPTNKEHDTMMETHTEYGQNGSIVMHGADLIEYRLVEFINDLPFEVPKDDKMDTFVSWKEATPSEKKNAVNLMEPTLRDAINNAIAGTEEVDAETAEN